MKIARSPRLVAEGARQPLEDLRFPLGPRDALQGARVAARDEADERRLRAVVCAVVVDHAERPVGGDDLPAVAPLAPEGSVVERDDLDRAAHRPTAKGCVSVRGEWRVEVDLGEQRRRERHHCALRAQLAELSSCDDAVGGLRQRSNRAREPNIEGFPERAQTGHERLRAFGQSILLGGSFDLRQRQEPAARVEVREKMERAHLVRLGAEDRTERGIHRAPHVAPRTPSAAEVVHGHRIELLRPLGRLWRERVDALP